MQHPGSTEVVGACSARRSRRPRLKFWLASDFGELNFGTDVQLSNDSPVLHGGPSRAPLIVPSSAATSAPEVQDFKRLLSEHKDLVKNYEEVTGRKIPDELLWRWARSKGGAEEALEPFLSHAIWRHQTGQIQKDSIAGELAAQKVFLQGCDLSGRPVIVVLAARHVIASRNLEETRKLICYTLETATSSANVKLNPVGQILCIFDLTGLRFGNLDSKALQAVFEVLQQHFPECLSELWFLNAPFIFWGLWKIVSPFIQPATKQKITFVNRNEQADKLASAIPAQVLPEDYGGSNQWVSIENAAAELDAFSRDKVPLKESASTTSKTEGRFGWLKRTGTFLKQHNPVWAARVFGRTVKQSASAIPRPGWTKRRPEIPLQARAFSSRVSSAWKNRPPMPRPSYRLQYHEGKTIHLAYLDVAVFYLICVAIAIIAYPWVIPSVGMLRLV